MGIDIITREVELTAGQKAAITRFVNKNCSYYYFLHFVRMANGNVKDAIMLYHFDNELRNLILKQVLDFELQIKKKLLDSILDCDSTYRWDNPKYYEVNYSIVSRGKKFSHFENMVTSANKRVKSMHYSHSNVAQNDRMFYATSYGNFLSIYNNLLSCLKIEFVNQMYIQENISLKKRMICLGKYFEGIQQIRNRCAHSNHILSKKLTNILNKMYIDNFDTYCKKYNKFERILYFMYKKSENSEKYKEELVKCLKKYNNVMPLCIKKKIFRPNFVKRVSEDWVKNN